MLRQTNEFYCIEHYAGYGAWVSVNDRLKFHSLQSARDELKRYRDRAEGTAEYRVIQITESRIIEELNI